MLEIYPTVSEYKNYFWVKIFPTIFLAFCFAELQFSFVDFKIAFADFKFSLVDSEFSKNVKTAQKSLFQWGMTQLFRVFDHSKRALIGGFYYFDGFLKKSRNNGRFPKKVHFSCFFCKFCSEKMNSKLVQWATHWAVFPPFLAVSEL